MDGVASEHFTPDRSTAGAAWVTAQMRLFIPRAPEVAFDFFADLRNEPRYNAQVSAVRKTSSGPVSLNTTFEGRHRGFGAVTWQLTEFDRPNHVVVEGRVGDGVYRWTSDFEPALDGTWMIGRMDWQPPRRLRPFRRLLSLILSMNARRSFGRMARLLSARRRR
jgi:hypothetical protein